MKKYEFKKWESIFKDDWFSCQPGVNGFLPIGKPLDKLPNQFQLLEDILTNMQIDKNGYLSKCKLGEEIENFKILNVDDIEDIQLLSALYRDYCFLASAYSLETSHYPIISGGTYGIARDKLPPQISEPLIKLSTKLGTYPWLDYAYGYGLNNAVLVGNDPTKQSDYKTIRLFNGNESEKGFINVHVAMVSQSGILLKHQCNMLQNLNDKNRNEFNNALREHAVVFGEIIEILNTMWKASNYKDYLSFRTFIMGQYNNEKCYPNTNIEYKFENGDSRIESWRGETGAQDSIIPSIDNLLQVKYPLNSLTKYLYDLRNYRPRDHQAYLNYVKEHADNLNFKQFCLDDLETSIYLLKNLNYLRMFRKKHWNLTKKYIIESTKHPVATGGTPITTWLPNQLGATLEYMNLIIENIEKNHTWTPILDNSYGEYYRNIKIEISDHIQSIIDEVKLLQPHFSNQEHDQFQKS